MSLNTCRKVDSVVVGEIIGASSKSGRKLTNTGIYKYHLCVCKNEPIYFFICSEYREGDFLITREDVAFLRRDSFVSLFLIRSPNFNSAARVKGVVSDQYLRRLLAHVDASEVMPAEDKELVSAGLRAHLCF